MFLAGCHREAQPKSWEFCSPLATVYSEMLVLLNTRAGQKGMKSSVLPVWTWRCHDPTLFFFSVQVISWAASSIKPAQGPNISPIALGSFALQDFLDKEDTTPLQHGDSGVESGLWNRKAETHQKHCCIVCSVLRFADVPVEVLWNPCFGPLLSWTPVLH